MELSENVILAYLLGRYECTVPDVYQYNSGMILKIVGPELPSAYTVDFANSVTGSSVSQVGNSDGVVIPDQFFVPGSTIHAWVVLTGADYVVTRYHIMIPISPRAARTSEEPTPSQQSALDEAIAALNDAVDAAETAITHYPTVIDGYWHVWDVSAGEYVSTGVAAQGPQGTPGQDGTDGTDGYSPTVTVTDIMGGHRVTVTDADGTHVFDVLNGTDGQDGSPGTDGADGQSAYVWIRYSSTQPTQDSDMKTTPDAWMGIYSGDSATAPTAYMAYTWYNIKGQAGPVSDVQVNGTSVVEDGVAKIPIAGTSLGVVAINTEYGIKRNANSGILQISNASVNIIKSPSGAAQSDYRPVTAGYVDAAAFYGLAKAAGADMKNIASTTVGVYPEAQKSAISQMLNGSVSVSGSTPAITALPGMRYICGEVATLDITLPASGCIDVVFESGSTPTVLTITPPTGVTVKWANGFDPTALEANTTYEINIADGLGVAVGWT